MGAGFFIPLTLVKSFAGSFFSASEFVHCIVNILMTNATQVQVREWDDGFFIKKAVVWMPKLNVSDIAECERIKLEL